ncbi:hypothetical protein N8083_01155 [Candidatus Pacebacteria bacterium]|nr:hypothetical protein [Candidatus Paceibacterota bacterium]
MASLLYEVTPTIHACVDSFYPCAPSKGADGNPKYKGFFYRNQAVTGTVYDVIFGTVHGGSLRSRETVGNKINLIVAEGVETSIEKRNPEADPMLWGGAGVCSLGLGCDGEIDGLTGAPELINHLTLCCAQYHSGRITQEDYSRRTDLGYPGILEAIKFAQNYGIDEGGYMALLLTIEYKFKLVAQDTA